jgi:hypothetical protein
VNRLRGTSNLTVGNPESLRENPSKGEGFLATYLRLAEISVGQSAPQPRDASRSTFSHTAKPIRTITVTTSFASVLLFIIPRPRPPTSLSHAAMGPCFRAMRYYAEESRHEALVPIVNRELTMNGRAGQPPGSSRMNGSFGAWGGFYDWVVNLPAPAPDSPAGITVTAQGIGAPSRACESRPEKSAASVARESPRGSSDNPCC